MNNLMEPVTLATPQSQSHVSRCLLRTRRDNPQQKTPNQTQNHRNSSLKQTRQTVLSSVAILSPLKADNRKTIPSVIEAPQIPLSSGCQGRGAGCDCLNRMPSVIEASRIEVSGCHGLPYPTLGRQFRNLGQMCIKLSRGIRPCPAAFGLSRSAAASYRNMVEADLTKPTRHGCIAG